MELNYFDIIISIIIILLGLKGIINGFFKEAFGLVGIVGGIFIASRVGNQVGVYLSEQIFKFENTAAINFTGFLVAFALFWLFMTGVGLIFKKLSSYSGLSLIDRIFGFIFGASKFFLIVAVISHAAYNIKAVKSSIDDTMKNSILFPKLVATGAFIMKMDPIEISNDINKSIDKVTDKVKENVKTSTQKIVEETKKEIESKLEEEH